MSHLLEIKDLQVRYHTEDGTVYALNHVDMELDDGEILGLVGETGAQPSIFKHSDPSPGCCGSGRV